MATKDFYILGAIVAADSERFTEEDLCPQTFKKALFGLKQGDEFILHINSVGGDVHAGMTIANLIRELNNKGVKTTAVIEGLAASISSVIACACDKIQMYESSFMMIHRCWGVVQGNSGTLRKQADVMDKIDNAILSYYHKHFNMTDEELEKVMDDETWIQGKEVSNYKLNCEVISTEKQFKVAACLDKMRFNNIPTEIISMKNKKIDEKTPLENTTEEEIETNEEKEESTQEEKVKQEETSEETKEEVKEEEEKEEEKEETTSAEPETDEESKEEDDEKKIEKTSAMVTKAEADSRVSGMQSTMQNKINALKKDYEVQLTNFKNQLQAKNEELISVRAEITSLTQKLEQTTNELQNAASALEEKRNALATLNASVLSPNEVTKDSWKNLRGQEFLDYVTAHRKELSN